MKRHQCKSNFLLACTLALLIVVTLLSASAHSGRTDSNGGHWNRSTGTYHYHNGGSNYTPAPNPAPQVKPTPSPTPQPNLSPTPVAPPTNNQSYEKFSYIPDFSNLNGVNLISSEHTDSFYTHLYSFSDISSEDILIKCRTFLENAGYSFYGTIDDDTTVFYNDEMYIGLGTIEDALRVYIQALDSNSVIEVVVNGKFIKFDQPPIIINGRVMVPIRYVVEKMDCSVEWDGNTQSVYVNQPNTPFVKQYTSKAMNIFVNNKIVIFPDQEPVVLNGRTLVPIRQVVENLDYDISWNEKLRTVFITKK